MELVKVILVLFRRWHVPARHGHKKLIKKLDMKVVKPMPMWMYNQAAINLFKSEASASSAKHVSIRLKVYLSLRQSKVVHIEKRSSEH